MEGLLDIVVNWLGSADSMMGLYTFVSLPRSPFWSTRGYIYTNPLNNMMSINSLLPRMTYTYWVKFTLEIVRLVYLRTSLLRSSTSRRIWSASCAASRQPPSTPRTRMCRRCLTRPQNRRAPPARGILPSQGRSAHEPAAEVGLGDGGTEMEAWSWEW